MQALIQGFEVVAVEPSRIYSDLVKTYLYDMRVKTLKYAMSDKDYENVEFYEADEDGLSTLNKNWLTSDFMPYNGKRFNTTLATTITLDTLVSKYGVPNLTKIDVEGAEWGVFKGLTQYINKLTFEWTLETLSEHSDQIRYLQRLGYTQVAPQFIEHHLLEPKNYIDILDFDFKSWHDKNKRAWELGLWKNSGLRPTSDVGMLWVK